MFTDKSSAAISVRQTGSGVERETKGSDVGTQRIVGHDCLLHQIRPLRVNARVEVLAIVAVRPPAEAAVFHRRQIVWHEIGTELIALVYHRPQGSRSWLPA